MLRRLLSSHSSTRLAAGAAAVAGGCAFAAAKCSSASHCDAQQPPPPLPRQPTVLLPPSQWLWTLDGVVIRRDEDTGATIFIDEATGNQLPDRPAHIPAEAYSRPWRWPPHPEWDAATANGKAAKKKGGARHVLLIRHSQYDLDGKDDAHRTLTELGLRQAARMGERLASIDSSTEGYYSAFSLTTLQSSELTRAIQTADVLSKALPSAVRSSDATLNEGRPCLPDPPPRHRASYNNRGGDSQRIEAAYRQICRRPSAEQPGDTYEVVVCHANVIRFVVCRALQNAPEAWLRMSLPHASLTHLVVKPNGDVNLRALGDAGHLPPEMVSY